MRPTQNEIARYDDLVESMSVAHQEALYRACSAANLTPTKYFALSAILKLGAPKMSPLASVLGLSPGAATTMVDRLIRDDLVERFTDPSDRRSVYVRASEKGKRALESARKDKQEQVREAFLRMDDGPRQQLLTGLEALMDGWNSIGQTHK